MITHVYRSGLEQDGLTFRPGVVGILNQPEVSLQLREKRAGTAEAFVRPGRISRILKTEGGA